MSAFDGARVRVPVMLSAGLCALVVGAGGFAGGYVVGERREAMGEVARPSARSLAPAPRAELYRFGTKTTTTSEVNEQIALLEPRATGARALPLELAELADLYLQRAQIDGDPIDQTRAAEAAQRSLELLPSANRAHLTLARLANQRHQFREAIALARAYLKTGNSPSAYLTLATAHLALGDLTAACDAAEMAVAERPLSGAYLMRALVLEAQGRDLEAAHDFERAVVVEDFGDPDAAARLRSLWGRFLVRRGELAGAERVLAEALRIVPEYPLALAQQGELALRRGQARQAIKLFDRAFAGGREVRYLIDRARAQDAHGDAKGAASTRTQVEILVRGELRDSGVGHRLDLVEILLDRGAPADLVEALALARVEADARPSADVLFQLARAYAKSGANAAAAVEIRRALATGSHDARVYALAAQIEGAAGNRKLAELYANEAARLGIRMGR